MILTAIMFIVLGTSSLFNLYVVGVPKSTDTILELLVKAFVGSMGIVFVTIGAIQLVMQGVL